jgi:hypothetical protein
VTRSRRLLAIVCIAVVVVTALAPASTDLLYAELLALDPIFGGLVVRTVAAPDDTRLPFAPCLTASFARPPPVV